jgi:hypothetical protein
MTSLKVLSEVQIRPWIHNGLRKMQILGRTGAVRSAWCLPAGLFDLLFDHEDGDEMSLWDVGKTLPNNTEFQPITSHSSSARLN